MPTNSAVPAQPDALSLIADLSVVLDRWGRWYLFGAQAVVMYGVPRLSADVDVTVRLDPDDPERFARAMCDAGFSLRIDDPEFVRRTRVIPFVHRRTGMPLDVVLAGAGLEDEFIERANLVDAGSVRVPVIDPEDLVIAKVLAGRSKDVDDAATLWRLRGATLNADRIRRVLSMVEEAIGQSDLVPRFESIRRGHGD